MESKYNEIGMEFGPRELGTRGVEEVTFGSTLPYIYILFFLLLVVRVFLVNLRGIFLPRLLFFVTTAGS